MDKHIVDEKTGIPYTLVGDHYLPWGDLPDDEPKQRPIGIWGQRRLRYIKQHRKALYTELLISGKWSDYLADINEEAEKCLFRWLIRCLKKEGITERLKTSNQMEWVRRMNNIRNRVEETVYTEMIYN